MRLPSWHELNEKISEFEKKAAEKIGEFKSGHPILAGALSGLFSIFPPPLNSIAQGIFDNADGSDEDKTNAVAGYFKNLQMQGEDHYNRVAAKLDGLFMEIRDLKQITAKESTLQTIQEILISSGKETNQKLDQLNNDLKQIGVKVDRIEEIANKDLIVDQDTNQRVRELESKFAYLVQINEERFTQHNITTTIKQGEDKQIPQSFVIELEQRNKEIEQLRAELSKLKHEPEFDIEYTLKTASAYYYDKKYDKAIELEDQILKVEPKNVDALINKGVALFKLGKYEEAISSMDKVLEIDPDYVDALINKGVALGQLGRFQDEISLHDKVLKIDPKNVLALGDKGNALYNWGRYEEALKFYDKALEINPQDVNALNGKGATLCSLGKYKEAIIYYDKALTIDPYFIFAVYGKASTKSNQNKIDESLNLLKQAILIDSNCKEWAKNDENFKKIKNDPRFIKLVS